MNAVIEVNKYAMLASMYRYHDLLAAKRLSQQQIKKEYQSVKRGGFLSESVSLPTLAKRYAIADETSFDRAVQQSWQQIVDEQLDLLIHLNIYLFEEKHYTVLSGEAFSRKYIQYDSWLSEKLHELSERWALSDTHNHDEFINSVKDRLINQFNNFPLKKRLAAFFKQHIELLPYIKEVGFIGLDISRIIDMTSCSLSNGLISLEKANQVINDAGSKTELAFDSWQSYLLSACVGKLWQGNNNSRYLRGTVSRFIRSVYVLANYHLPIYTSSGLWEQSDLRLFTRLVRDYLPKEIAYPDEKYRIWQGREFFSVFVQPLIDEFSPDFGLSLGDTNDKQYLADQLADETSQRHFENLVKVHHYRLPKKAFYPLIVCNQAVVTTSGILARKRRVIRFVDVLLPWTENWQYQFDVDRSHNLILLVDGFTVLSFKPNLKSAEARFASENRAANISKSQFLQLTEPHQQKMIEFIERLRALCLTQAD